MAKSFHSPQSLSRRLYSSTLRVIDESLHLKDVNRAFACLKRLLNPVPQEPDYAELVALVSTIDAELTRRTERLDAEIQRMCKCVDQMMKSVKRQAHEAEPPKKSSAATSHGGD